MATVLCFFGAFLLVNGQANREFTILLNVLEGVCHDQTPPNCLLLLKLSCAWTIFTTTQINSPQLVH